MGQPTILIIDDESDIRESIGNALKYEPYELRFAENGKEGLDCIQKHCPMVVLLDIRMPLMSGLEVLQKLQVRPEDPYMVIVLTGHGDDDEVQQCYELGIHAFLRKPFNIFELQGAVKHCIRLKQTQIALKQSEHSLRIVTENAPDYIIQIDRDGMITYMNRPAPGHTLKDMVGTDLRKWIEPGSQQSFENALIQTFDTGETQYYESVGAITKKWYLNRLSTIKEEGHAMSVVLIATEITQQKELEKELRVAMDLAQAANQAKSQFLNNMSHEFRTPLHAIVGFSQNLLSQTIPFSLPDELRQQLKNIHICGQTLSEQINSILDFSKIEAGKIEILEEDFNLTELVTNLFEVYKFQAHQKGVVFSYEIDPKLPLIIRSDRMKLTQILTNLLGNAIKFTPENKEVKFKVIGEKEGIAFLVIDQGIGIPEDRKEAIFENFEQADNSISRRFGGTGLGLAISKKLTEMLGGRISGASPGEGQGSTFNVLIPYKEADTPARQVDFSSEEQSVPKDKIILIVEDDLMIQDLMKNMLEIFELEVHLADDGKRGVEKALTLQAEGHPPDLILMDLQMPNMDGIEATQQIRLHPECQEIPIIALSGNAFTEQQQQAFNAGITDYLVKPFNLVQLKTILNKYLLHNIDQQIGMLRQKADGS